MCKKNFAITFFRFYMPATMKRLSGAADSKKTFQYLFAALTAIVLSQMSLERVALRRLWVAIGEDSSIQQKAVTPSFQFPTVEDTTSLHRELLSVQDTRFAFAQENVAELDSYRRGGKKAFFPLKTLADNETRVGYVVAEPNPSLRMTMTGAYKFATEVISNQFGMRHTYLQPPEVINISSSFRDWLSQRTLIRNVYKGAAPMPQLFHNPEGLLVQLMAEAPEGSLLWGKHRQARYNSSGLREALEWVQGIPNDKKVSALKTLRNSTSKLFELFDAYPCLYRDSQFFVLETGELMHFDVDRCFIYENSTFSYFAPFPYEVSPHPMLFDALLRMFEFEIFAGKLR